MPLKVRIKQVLTFAQDGSQLPVGVLTVGEDITKEQFDAIKDNQRFCEVLEVPEPPKQKPKPKPKAEVEPEVE